MKDTIIKGTGNSRRLKTVPNALTLYPSYVDFIQAMVSGEFPIDLGPINPAGVDTKGTDLTAANLLKDATAALYGKTSAATPDEILASIRPLITTAQNSADEKCIITVGSYVGTGKSGENNPNSISFSFAPKLILFPGFASSSDNAIWIKETKTLTTSYVINQGFGYPVSIGNTYYNTYGKKSANGRTIYWYNSEGTSNWGAPGQFNRAGSTYHYIAFG